MKHIHVKNIAALLLALCMLSAFSGCRKNKTSSGDAGSGLGSMETLEFDTGSDVPGGDSASGEQGSGAVSGGTASGGTATDGKKYTVTVGFSAEEKNEFQKLIPVFQKKYPNIKVSGQQINTSLLNITPKWTSLAAAGKMPDVLIGSESFGYIMQQGWAYPLDNLLAADADRADALDMGLSRYTYGGHLYALPYRLQLNGIVLNLDLLNELNESKPSYGWTTDEFLRLCKKATTPEYSGINYLIDSNPTYSMDVKFMNAMLPVGYEQFGYSMNDHNFNLTANNAWVNSVNLVKELQSVPGLVSDELKDYSLRDNGKVDDYDKKFGKNADAYVSGKVLCGNSDSWNMNWWRTFKFKYDFYPIPTQANIPQRIQTHVDFVFMSAAVAQDKAAAAYKLVRFLSYDPDGCITRLEASLKSEQTYGQFRLYLPATENKTVIDRFCAESVFPEGMKYMLKSIIGNPQQTVIADTDKIVPDFWQNVDQYRSQATEKVAAGTDPASLVNDMQTKINSAMSSTWNYLNKKINTNLENFYKSHPDERK